MHHRVRSIVAFIFLFLLWQGTYGFTVQDDSLNHHYPWWTPHFIPLQFAGNIGLVSAGIGYSSRAETYQVSLHYGYVPESVALARIHTVSVRNVFNFYSLSIPFKKTIVPYAGLGLSLEVSGNAFLKLPSYYPRKYYFPKAIHILGYAGLRTRHLMPNHRLLRGVDFYAETGSMDAYIWYKAISSEVRFRQILSAAAGVNLLLRR
jgi:hypothetical protein